MSNWQKEAIKRFRELHPEISDETWNEVINSVGGSFNHTIKIETPQPLFTLTAEEVEIIERNLVYFFKSDKEEVDKILTRIKQWQDENRINN